MICDFDKFKDNKFRQDKFIRAFSLIEISIVFIVIGVLVSGISAGMDLYDDFKLKIAQTQTKNSRVSRISDLELWLETTLENAMATGTTSFKDKANLVNQESIGRWNDANPNILSTARNNATQSTLANQPKYIRKGINGLPALYFDGTDDFFSYNGNFLVGSDYTIFVVEARGSRKVSNFFISGYPSAPNTCLILGYRNDSAVTQSQNQNDLDISVANFTSPIPSIYSFSLATAIGKSIYLNGVLKNSNSQKSQLISYGSPSISGGNWGFYIGHIAEMIFYSRALRDKERQDVESYLSKKWGIKLQ